MSGYPPLLFINGPCRGKSIFAPELIRKVIEERIANPCLAKTENMLKKQNQNLSNDIHTEILRSIRPM